MAKGRKLAGWQKMAVDFGPLVMFFLGYFMPTRLGPPVNALFGTEFFTQDGNELFLAMILFTPAYLVAFVASILIERRIAPMLLVNGVIAIGLGVLALVFQSKTLVYIKPTVIYTLFALVLGGGLLSGRNFLKLMFDDAFQMPDAAWRTLTWRFAAAFLVMAVANEIAWRTLTAGCVPDAECAGESTWVNVKLFGFTGAYLVFVITQTPFITKNMQKSGTDNASGAVVDGPDETAAYVAGDAERKTADDAPTETRKGSSGDDA